MSSLTDNHTPINHHPTSATGGVVTSAFFWMLLQNLDPAPSSPATVPWMVRDDRIGDLAKKVCHAHGFAGYVAQEGVSGMIGSSSRQPATPACPP